MLKNAPTLIVFKNQEIIFQSNEKWLYPLFSFEDFLEGYPIDMNSVCIHDKVVGKAAAMLIARLRPDRVHGEVMSELAVNYLNQFGLSYSFDQLVERIQCKTEMILLDVDDVNEAYDILCKRAGRC